VATENHQTRIKQGKKDTRNCKATGVACVEERKCQGEERRVTWGHYDSELYLKGMILFVF
jgi:hypothetical protein